MEEFSGSPHRPVEQPVFENSPNNFFARYLANESLNRTSDGRQFLNEFGQLYRGFIGNAIFHSTTFILPTLTEAAAVVAFRPNLPARIAPISPQKQSHEEALEWLRSEAGLSKERVSKLLGVSRQSVHSWSAGKDIRSEHRQRLLALREVLQRAIDVQGAGDRLLAWLDTPRGIDGRTPAQLLEVADFNRARLLATTTRSPRLKSPPTWISREIPPSLRTRGDARHSAFPLADEDSIEALSDTDDSVRVFEIP